MYSNTTDLNHPLLGNHIGISFEANITCDAGDKCNIAFLRGIFRRLLYRIAGKQNRLLDLQSIERQIRVTGRYYAGIQTVHISQIVGSEGRTNDFDKYFQPMTKHNRERWIRIAVAHKMSQHLPPIKLIQIGDRYFVRDGHHRISVYRNYGAIDIDAEITQWNVCGPLPWESAFSVNFCPQPA
jgi:hypothetical protein